MKSLPTYLIWFNIGQVTQHHLWQHRQNEHQPMVWSKCKKLQTQTSTNAAWKHACTHKTQTIKFCCNKCRHKIRKHTHTHTQSNYQIFCCNKCRHKLRKHTHTQSNYHFFLNSAVTNAGTKYESIHTKTMSPFHFIFFWSWLRSSVRFIMCQQWHTVRSDVKERVTEELAWKHQNVPAWPKYAKFCEM